MVAPLALLITLALSDSLGSSSDTLAARPRHPVREFPVVVHAPLHDLLSSESVHEIEPAELRSLPVDRLSDLVALKAGVVADGEELHVRGGRAGETRLYLSGVDLGDPVRGATMQIPL